MVETLLQSQPEQKTITVSIPLPQKNEQGKLLRFYPVQRDELLGWQYNRMTHGCMYLGMCLRHDYGHLINKRIPFKSKRFFLRWEIAKATFHRNLKKLEEIGFLKIGRGFIVLLDSFQKACAEGTCSEIVQDIFFDLAVSPLRQDSLILETEIHSNPLPSNVLGDSLDINIREIKYGEIKYNKTPPLFLDEKRGGMGREKQNGVELEYQTISTSFEVQPTVYHYEQSNMEIKEGGQNGGWLVIQDAAQTNPVLFGDTQPTPIPMQVEVIQPTPMPNPQWLIPNAQIPTQAEDNQPISLPTKTISPSTPQTPHDDYLPGGGNDSCSEVIEVEWVEEVLNVASECGENETVEAEIVVETVEDVPQKTDGLAVKIEEEVGYPPEVQRAIDLYDRNGIIPRVHELNMWAEVEIGEYVKLYRKSGRILSSKPNDVISEFRKFLINKKEASNPIAWINAMEKDPKRWGELADMVQEFKEIEFKNSEEGKSLRIEYYKNKGSDTLGEVGSKWSLS